MNSSDIQENGVSQLSWDISPLEYQIAVVWYCYRANWEGKVTGDDTEEMRDGKPTMRLSFKPCLGVRDRRLTIIGVMKSDWFSWHRFHWMIPMEMDRQIGGGQIDKKPDWKSQGDSLRYYFHSPKKMIRIPNPGVFNSSRITGSAGELWKLQIPVLMIAPFKNCSSW